MKVLFMRMFWWAVFLVLLAGGAWAGYGYYVTAQVEVVETTSVQQGTLVQSVSASGKVHAKQIARLGFSVTGTIQEVYKDEGERVETDEVIASLTSDALVAEYEAALERLRFFEEQKQELVLGPTYEERTVAQTNVQVAAAALAQVEAEYDQAIKNARQDLLSNDLRLYPTKKDNDDIPPTISGNYLCEEEGEYMFSLYRSNANSNISYNITGLATKTLTANLDTPVPFDDCGLYIQFDETEIYRDGTWVLSIPNRRSDTYLTYRNAYDLLVAQRDAALKTAAERVTLAKSSEQQLVAPATAEAVAKANASIAETRAILSQHEARIADYTIRAPFSGVVTDVAMKVGEPASAQHTVTIVREGDYELIAQVPEIDINHVSVGDVALITFDAESNEQYQGVVTFVSPVATNISGVSYYDTHILFDAVPSWVREGLNADVEIVQAKINNVSYLPERFVVQDGATAWVYQETAAGPQKVPVTLGAVGVGGYVEVDGLPVGAAVRLP